MKSTGPSSHYGTPARRKGGLSQDIIERLPAEILTYLAQDSERLGRFFDVTGLNIGTLRQAASAPGFDRDLLEYLGSDENLLRDFAETHQYDPAEVDMVRLRLAGPSAYD